MLPQLIPKIKGDSACPIESAYVFINKGDELNKVDAVRVLVVQDTSDKEARMTGTPDMQLLARLCAENDWSTDASDRVLAFERSFANVSAAMPLVRV